MSNGFQFSFYPSHNAIFLTYWDSLHGKDISIKVSSKGFIYWQGKKITSTELYEKLMKFNDKLMEEAFQ